MIANVRATYSNGVLTPLEPLDLEEGKEVALSIDPAPGLSAKERRRTMEGHPRPREAAAKHLFRPPGQLPARTETLVPYLLDTDWGTHCLHGATALRHDLTLISNNRRHFERVQGLSILSV